jgi:hypothetical protein
VPTLPTPSLHPATRSSLLSRRPPRPPPVQPVLVRVQLHEHAVRHLARHSRLPQLGLRCGVRANNDKSGVAVGRAGSWAGCWGFWHTNGGPIVRQPQLQEWWIARNGGPHQTRAGARARQDPLTLACRATTRTSVAPSTLRRPRRSVPSTACGRGPAHGPPALLCSAEDSRRWSSGAGTARAPHSPPRPCTLWGRPPQPPTFCSSRPLRLALPWRYLSAAGKLPPCCTAPPAPSTSSTTVRATSAGWGPSACRRSTPNTSSTACVRARMMGGAGVGEAALAPYSKQMENRASHAPAAGALPWGSSRRHRSPLARPSSRCHGP